MSRVPMPLFCSTRTVRRRLAASFRETSEWCLPRPTGPSYLYKAEVHDVIDADTLLLDINLGFEVIRFTAVDEKGQPLCQAEQLLCTHPPQCYRHRTT